MQPPPPDPDQSPQRSGNQRGSLVRFAVFSLLGLQVLIVAVVVALTAPESWRTRWVQDDAYISFRYARNLVEGHGLVYNPGEQVEGYTNFLWTMIAAVPLAAGAEDPLPVMHLLSMGLWLGTYGLLVLLGLALARRGVLIGPLIALPPLFLWSYNQWFLSGMETGLVSLLMVLLIVLLTCQDLHRPARAALLGLTVTALLLARPDTAFFVAGVGVAGLLCQWRWLTERTFWNSWVPAMLLPVVVIYIPYTGWRLGYYGDFFPNTYYAKMAYLPAYDRGREYLVTFLRVYDLRPFLPLPVIAALIARDQAVRRFLGGAVLGSAATVVYIWRLGGDFMEWRFMMPITGVFVPAVGVAAYVISQRAAELVVSRRRDRADPSRTAAVRAARIVGVTGALAVLAFLGHVCAEGGVRARNIVLPGQEDIPSLAKYAKPEYAWQEIGRACDRVLPKDLRIATTAAGMLPYFARRPTLDLHGLTSPAIARKPLGPDEDRGRVGHERFLKSFEAMRQLGVSALVHTERLSPVPLALASIDTPHEVMVSVRIGRRRHFNIRLFDPSPSTLDELHRHEEVIFSNPAELAPKEMMVEKAGMLATHRLVDRLDLECAASELEHGYAESFDRDEKPQHDYHTKILGYDLPEGMKLLRDEGRRLFHQATWRISGVVASRDLMMIVRYDRNAFTRYQVFVNGRRTPRPLTLDRSDESWAEVPVVIPSALLVDGTNEITLTKDRSRTEVAELYHVWFLQEISK